MDGLALDLEQALWEYLASEEGSLAAVAAYGESQADALLQALDADELDAETIERVSRRCMRRCARV